MYRLDSAKRVLLRDGEPVSLQPKAMEILLALIQRPSEVVSKDELMQAVWGDAFVEEANLSQSIFVLRKALGERASENRYVATIPGRGYSFVASVKEVAECIEDPTATTVAKNRRGRNGPLGTMRLLPIAIFLALIFGMAVVSPKVTRSLNNRGMQHQKKGEIGAALEDYSWALRLGPDTMFLSTSKNNAEVYYDLGDVYEKSLDYEKALDQYESAINADPRFYPAYKKLCQLYILRDKDYVGEDQFLQRILSMQPKENSYTIYKNYGQANLALGHYTIAERNLRLAVSLAPERGYAHCLLARTLTIRPPGRDDTDAVPEWKFCLAYSDQAEVGPEWRNEAQENLKNYHNCATGDAPCLRGDDMYPNMPSPFCARGQHCF